MFWTLTRDMWGYLICISYYLLICTSYYSSHVQCHIGELRPHVSVCDRVLQYVAVCCSVLQCVAVWEMRSQSNEPPTKAKQQYDMRSNHETKYFIFHEKYKPPKGKCLPVLRFSLFWNKLKKTKHKIDSKFKCPPAQRVRALGHIDDAWEERPIYFQGSYLQMNSSQYFRLFGGRGGLVYIILD